MTDKPAATLFYVHDPMCSWCWGFRNEWLKLKASLPPSVQLVSYVGGLAPDSDKPMPEALQRDIQSAWRRIEQVIPGTKFNFDFWTQNTPRRATYPACRAVITAREMDGQADAMTYGIQQAYYLQAKNPSNIDTLVDVAESIGLEANDFRQRLQSDEVQQALEAELANVRDLGVFSFPSLVLRPGNELHGIKLDYISADNMLHEINRLIDQH
jgi:putative protein-disulfide isomerase